MVHDDTRYVKHTASDGSASGLGTQLVESYLNDSPTDKGLLSARSGIDKNGNNLFTTTQYDPVSAIRNSFDDGVTLLANVGSASFELGDELGVFQDLLHFGIGNIGSVPRLTVVDHASVDRVLTGQKLQLSDLLDTSKAIQVGRDSAAQWVLTGAVVEMPHSLVLFVRVIDVRSGEIMAVSQEVVEKTAEVSKLL